MFNEDWYSQDQCNNLIELVKSVNNLPGVVIEVGCWEGKSTVSIANSCYPDNVICNDTWLGNVSESNLTGIKHGIYNCEITFPSQPELNFYYSFLLTLDVSPWHFKI